MIAANTVTASGVVLHCVYIASALICAITYVYSRQLAPSSTRVRLSLLASASAIWILVDVITLAFYLADGRESVPLWVHYLYFCWMIPIIAAVVLNMRRLQVSMEQPFIIRSVITAVSVFGFYWTTVLHPVWSRGDASLGHWILNVIIPLGNIIILSLLFVHLTNRPGTFFRELLLFGLGYSLLGFTDANLILRLNENEYSSLAAYNIGHWAGPLLIAGGMWVRYTTKPPIEITPPIVFRDRQFSESYVPYVPLIAYSLFEVINSLNDHEHLVAEFVTFAGIVLIVLTICRYQRLNARERVLLEGNVVEQSTELARSHLLNQRIIGVAADGIIAVDPFDRVVLINRAALDILGYAANGAGVPTIPSDVHGLFHRDKKCTGQCILSDILHDTSSESHIVTLDTPRQQVIIELSVRTLDGPTSGYVLVFHDITEQVSLSNLKDEFILLVSHEIRTPLTSIRGSLGLLDHGVLGDFSDEARNMISVALQNSDRLLRLINDVLDLERMETGKRPLHLQWQTVEVLFSEVVRSLQPLVQSSAITLETHHNNCSVMVDYDRIIQVLINLVQNAIKFSPQHSTVTLTVDIFDDYAQFAVQDEGRGIPVDHLDKVFEAFHQVDASDTRDKSGTGLGLAISREIVNAHGGRIWAEACPERGTIFKFTIPMWSRPADPIRGTESNVSRGNS